MIIEIKDLPPGRKVNRILVDITFEDSGSNLIKTEFNSFDSIDNPTDNPSTTYKQKGPDVPKPSEPTEERKHKDIPDEMKNLEF